MSRSSFLAGARRRALSRLPTLGRRIGLPARPARIPGPYSGTPLQRAESILGDALADDLADQLRAVEHARAALRNGRRERCDDEQQLRLRSRLATVEGYLALARRRQQVWRRDGVFDHDLAARVLVMARIADRREIGARARNQYGSGRFGAQAQFHLTAMTAYLRQHHPPADTLPRTGN